MMREEFTELTGMYVSDSMYKVIEEHYMNMNMKKENFCSAYKKNKNGLAEKIQRQVDMEYHKKVLERASEERKVEELEKQLEEAKAENQKLEELLDQYGWEQYTDPDNVSEESYKRFEGSISLTRGEAMDIISDEFGFIRERIDILDHIGFEEKNVRTGEIRVSASKSIERRPYFESSDFNYIRFDVYAKKSTDQYEMLDGELRKFRS